MVGLGPIAKKVIQRFIYLKLYLLSSGAPTRRASGAAEAAVWNWVDPWAPPLPQQPALGLGAGLAAKGSLVGFGWLVSTGGGRRGGEAAGLWLVSICLFSGNLLSFSWSFPWFSL